MSYTEDIESFLTLFENLSLNSSEQLNQSNMPETTDYQLLRLSLDSIPHFDGNPHTLNVFIDNCDFLYSNFRSNSNNALNSFILRAIIGKLTGRALMLIGSRIELKTWDEVKAALRLSFGDQRNLDCLVQDLIILRPLKGESAYNFGMRCQDARSLIVSKINSMNLANAEKIIRLQNYDDFALKTYIRGLPGPLQQNVRLRNPDSLEKAMGLVIEEENFLYATNRSNTLNLQSYYRPTQKVIPVKPNNQQPRPHFVTMPIQQPNFNFRPPTFHNSQPFNFPRPVNSNFTNWRPNFQQNHNQWQPRPTFNQNAPVFRPNFGQPNNSFKPNQNNNQKIEPMDTSSGYSRVTQQSQGKPNWTATELFNQNVAPIYFSEVETPFENDSNGTQNTCDQSLQNTVQENPDLDYYQMYCAPMQYDPSYEPYSYTNAMPTSYQVPQNMTNDSYQGQANDNNSTNDVNFCFTSDPENPT